MKSYVLSILFMGGLHLDAGQHQQQDSIAFITGQDKMRTLEKVAERIIGRGKRKGMKCRNAMIKTDSLPGSQLRALREGGTYSF